MFGVRIMDARQIIDLKIFRSLDDARNWSCNSGHTEYDTSSIFEVADATDPRDANAAIRSRDSCRIKLIETRESGARINSRLAMKQHKAMQAALAMFKARQKLQTDLLKQAEAAREASLIETRGGKSDA